MSSSSSLSLFLTVRLWMLVAFLMATTTPCLVSALTTTTTTTTITPTQKFVQRTATATTTLLRARAYTLSNQQHQQSLHFKSNINSIRQYATRRHQRGKTSSTALSAATALTTPTTTTAGTWTSEIGDSALRNVQALASKVATATTTNDASTTTTSTSISSIAGTGGESNRMARSGDRVQSALQSLEQDMHLLDQWVLERPQLTLWEFCLLAGSVIVAGAGPLVLHGEATELLSPAAAAFSAAIGIGAEYVGKVAVADGKEVAAATMQCAAEAEGLLANAERAKAVTPLCVGVGATAASFALLIPVLLASLELSTNVQLVTEIYLLCPLVAIFATAVCSLALEETKGWCRRATSVGNRRFAKAGIVGRTWLSNTEQINAKSINASQKWQTFATSVIPAPFLGALIPGTLPTKAIFVTATAAAQTAFYLAQAEFALSRATDAVALKSRSAAVCDTYANQGARSAAILPFTSALSSLCAAATAAIVELPLLEALGGTAQGTILQMLIVTVFPACSALLAGAASVSKARCEVDAEAATQAASTLALEYSDEGQDPVLQPFKGVVELIQLAAKSTLWEPIRRKLSSYWIYNTTGKIWKWLSNTLLRRGPNSGSLVLDNLKDSVMSFRV